MSNTSVRLAQLMPLIQERLAAGESVQFTPHGTSMRPLLEGGRDQVILAPLPNQLKKYDLPLYRRDNGQFVLHRIVKVGETYTCIGDNQFEYETGLRQEQMIALATGVIHKGKQYQFSSMRYWLYCRFWHGTRPIRRAVEQAPYILAAIKRRIRKLFGK